MEQTRSDGNIIKVTEYDLTKDKYNPVISDAVRTHSEKVPENATSRHSDRHSKADTHIRTPPSPATGRFVII